METVATLDEATVQDIANGYRPPHSALETATDFRRLGREVRRAVIREGGQGDCVSVSTAIAAVLEELSIPHTYVSMEQGQYHDESDVAPHAWIIIEEGWIPAATVDTILDATAEQFLEIRAPVHVLPVDELFARAHYTTPLHQKLRSG